MVVASPSCVNRRRQNTGRPIIAQEEKPAWSNLISEESEILNLRANLILFRTPGCYGLFISWIIRL